MACARKFFALAKVLQDMHEELPIGPVHNTCVSIRPLQQHVLALSPAEAASAASDALLAQDFEGLQCLHRALRTEFSLWSLERCATQSLDGCLPPAPADESFTSTTPEYIQRVSNLAWALDSCFQALAASRVKRGVVQDDLASLSAALMASFRTACGQLDRRFRQLQFYVHADLHEHGRRAISTLLGIVLTAPSHHAGFVEAEVVRAGIAAQALGCFDFIDCYRHFPNCIEVPALFDACLDGLKLHACNASVFNPLAHAFTESVLTVWDEAHTFGLLRYSFSRTFFLKLLDVEEAIRLTQTCTFPRLSRVWWTIRYLHPLNCELNGYGVKDEFYAEDISALVSAVRFGLSGHDGLLGLRYFVDSVFSESWYCKLCAEDVALLQHAVHALLQEHHDTSARQLQSWLHSFTRCG